MSVESNAAVDTLEGLVLQLASSRDRDFARDLIKAVRQHGPTSGRMEWIGKLTERAQQPRAQQMPQQVDLGDFKGVYALFAKAKEHLKFPKVRLQLATGSTVLLALAGPNSRAPNTLNVTDGKPYGQNKWYGRVDAKGVWTKARDAFAEADQVEALLRAMSIAPAQTASEYGRLTGHCCFCDRPLKDEQSTAAGYGPTCAENFGLAAVRKAAVPILEQLTENDQ